MRLVHTSDWHLGHVLHDHDRGPEHDAFLAWLLDQLAAHEVDALLIAGDIFDTANPPAAAQHRWYHFLARARARLPRLDIVVIGGNHDSAARLDAPDPLLHALGVRVVGGVPWRGSGLDLDRLLAPLTGPDGHVRAWVAAVPFLRPADLPRVETEGDAMVEGVRALYAQVLDAARARRTEGQALVAMGHCYMTGTRLSELSERKILGGNQHALPVDLFPDDLSYAALGHLHLAQHVGSERVRYSGSPIPLALNERDYPHQVLLVDLDGADLAGVCALRVPRTVDLLRVPAEGAAELEVVLAALRDLPPGGTPETAHPLLEVHVTLPKPEPTLRRQVEDALADRGVRLARLAVHYTGTGLGLADATDAVDLSDLTPETVFALAWSRAYASAVAPEVLQAFLELYDHPEVRGDA